MDRKRALTSETLTRVFSDLDDDQDGELGPRVFASALQVRPQLPILIPLLSWLAPLLLCGLDKETLLLAKRLKKCLSWSIRTSL
jgi:hypothetical protein